MRYRLVVLIGLARQRFVVVRDAGDSAGNSLQDLAREGRHRLGNDAVEELLAGSGFATGMPGVAGVDRDAEVWRAAMRGARGDSLRNGEEEEFVLFDRPPNVARTDSAAVWACDSRGA
jgi:hypothetical protein